MSCDSFANCSLDGVTRVCYQEVTFSNEQSFCDCPNWFGFIGDNCDVPTANVYYMKISLTLMATWAAILLMLTMRTLLLNLYIGSNPITGTDPVMYAGGFISAGAALLLTYAVNVLKGVYDPSRIQIVTYSNIFVGEYESVSATSNNLDVLSLYLSTAFNIFAAFCLVQSWQGVMERVSKFQSLENQKRIKKTSKGTKRIAFSYVLLFIVLAILKRFLAVLIVTFLATAIASVTLVVIAWRFARTIEAFDTQKTDSILITKVIRRIARITIVFTSLSMILVLIYTVTIFTYRFNLKPGSLNYSLMIRDSAVFSGLAFSTACSWYFNSSTEGIMLVDGWITCAMFRYWDKENLRLLPSSEVEENAGDEKNRTQVLTVQETYNIQSNDYV